jgi:hypothetical protein
VDQRRTVLDDLVETATHRTHDAGRRGQGAIEPPRGGLAAHGRDQQDGRDDRHDDERRQRPLAVGAHR